MGTRLELQTVLEDILGTDKVYFQPPANVSMVYPAIVYERDYRYTEFADNIPHCFWWRYQVTVIDKNPDSPTLDKVGALPMSHFVRHFAIDNLNHDIFDVYF